MAENYLIVGDDRDVVFGTEDVGYAGIGTIVSASHKHGGDKLEIKGRSGGVICVIYFNEKDECEIEAIFDSTITLPARGDTLSLCGLTLALCEEWEKKWENEKECILTIRATRYEAIAIFLD
jgi:hypothetical protein